MDLLVQQKAYSKHIVAALVFICVSLLGISLVAYLNYKVVLMLAVTSVLLPLFLRWPFAFVTYLIALRKIIDLFWFVRFDVHGVSLSYQRAIGGALPLLCVLLLIGNAAIHRNTATPPYAHVILAFIGYIVFEAVVSPLRVLALEDAFKLVSPYVIYFIGYQYFTNRRRIDNFAKVYVISCVVPFCTVLLQQAGYVPAFFQDIQQQHGAGHLTRYAGLYGDAGTACIYMIVGFSLIYYLHKTTTFFRSSLLLYFFFFICSYMVFFSFVRSFWIVLLLQILLWLILERKPVKVSVCVVIGIALFIWQLPFMKYYFCSFFELATVDLSDPWSHEYLFSGRVGVWHVIVSEFLRTATWLDYLVGRGLGYSGYVVQSLTSYDYTMRAHSDYVEYLVEFGILGFSLHLLIIFSILRKVWKLRLEGDLTTKALTNSWLMLVFPYLAFGFLSWPSKWVSFTWPMWLWGAAVFRYASVNSSRA